MAAASASRNLRRTAVLLGAASIVLLACGGNSDAPVSSLDPSQGGDSRPAVTAPPAEEPAPAEGVDDESLTTEEWILVILLGLLVLAAVAGIGALLSRGSKGKSAGATSNQVLLDDITRTCRSIHDSSVLSLLQANDPVSLQSGWAAARGQLVGLEGRISQLAVGISDAADLRTVHELGAAVTGVRGALEANVRLRIDEPVAGHADLVEASNRTVLCRSEQLESAFQRALYLRL